MGVLCERMPPFPPSRVSARSPPLGGKSNTKSISLYLDLFPKARRGDSSKRTRDGTFATTSACYCTRPWSCTWQVSYSHQNSTYVKLAVTRFLELGVNISWAVVVPRQNLVLFPSDEHSNRQHSILRINTKNKETI